jgi:hypothetical protein
VLDLFRDAAATALASIGQASLLRGTEPCNVHIAHGVQIEGLDDNAVYTRSVATILSDMTPKEGDALHHPDGDFILDSKLKSNGVSIRFVIRKATPAP